MARKAISGFVEESQLQNVLKEKHFYYFKFFMVMQIKLL